MSAWAAFRSAWRALAANALRSVLTMLGIIIGVGAVIAMVAVGQGATDRVQEQMQALGSNIMLVVPGGVSQAGVRLGAQTRQRLTEEDALAIGLEIPEVQVAAPTSRATGQVVWGNSNWGTTVMGVNNEYLEARDWPLRSGRVFDMAELAGSAKVVWLGATVARELFGDQDPVEQTVRLRGIPMTVVGVLSPKGQNSMGQDQDDVVMLPLGTLRNRVWGGDATSRLKRVGAISVKVREGQDMGAVEERIKELLRQRFKVQPGAEDPFSVRNLTEMLRAQEESSRVMTLLLATVAGISLVIGGIGIMNIMLVSVTERTREIGLRMAVGARGRDILAQFLIEAITLSLAGGALGVVLGAAATWLIGTLADWQVSLSPGAVLLAVTIGSLLMAVNQARHGWPALVWQVWQRLASMRHVC
jgi:putative ABC transport system permease protein